ncbi:MAG: HD domain-containing protein [Candidatus Pacebacteria bacterium]|nr:HD domain-containing protein [Candidatus Paceibacterota bacterium]
MEDIISRNLSKLINQVVKKKGRVFAVKDFALSEALRRFGYDSFSDNLDIEIYDISEEGFKDILKSMGIAYEKEKGIYYLEGVGISIVKIGMMDSARNKGIILDSLFLDLDTGELKDYFEGLIDIQQGFIRYTDQAIFKSDIFNIFRSIQLASQLGFRIDKDITDLDVISLLIDFKKDFRFSYWKDLLLNSSVPSIGIEYLRGMGILKKAHTEIDDLVGVGQNPKWHQEGDAWTHTKMVIDAGAIICRRHNLDEDDALTLMLSCLCHDLGKPIATKMVDGVITTKGHDKEGKIPTKVFLSSIGVPKDIAKKVVILVSEHMFTHNDKFTEKEVTDLSKRIFPAKVKDLVYLAEADCMGMINCQKDNNARNNLFEMAKKLGLE